MNKAQRLEAKKMTITMESLSDALRKFGVVVSPRELGVELLGTSAEVRLAVIALNNAKRLLNWQELEK